MQNGGDLLGQLDMQLRTSTEAIITSIRQGFGGSDESANQRLRPCICESKNAKIAKICDLRKFNSEKVKGYMVLNHAVASTGVPH